MFGRRYGPALASLLVLLVGLAAAWWWLPRQMDEGPATRTMLDFPDLSCRFQKPDLPWHDAGGTVKSVLNARLVLERDQPRSWLALLVEDYQDEDPTDAVLHDTIVRRLGSYFSKENLESDEGPQTTMAGHAARQIVFRGEIDNHSMNGICAMFSERGLAYWLAMWVPAADGTVSEDQFAEMRRRLVLLDKRKDRKPAVDQKRTLPIAGTPAVLEVVNRIWEQWEPASDFDEFATLALVARQRRKPSENKGPALPVAASAIVLVLKPGEDKLPAAEMRVLDYLGKQQKKLYPETQLDKLAGPNLSADAAKENRKLIALKVRNGEHRHLYFLLAIVAGKDSLIAVQCECPWAAQATWEPLFLELAKGFQLPERS
jgi:hypothetical protein